MNGEGVALNLVHNTLHPTDSDGMVYGSEHGAEFEVDQDYETTSYIFDEFTINYSGGEISVTC